MHTFQNIIDGINQKRVRIVGPFEREEILEVLQECPPSAKAFSMVKTNLIKNKNGFIIAYSSPQKNHTILNDVIYLLNPKGQVEAIIGEIELANPFFFKNIVVAPGTDAIMCYDLTTGESETNYIR